MFVLCNIEGKPGIEQTIASLKKNETAKESIIQGLELAELDPGYR
jgi:hypothetical protein